MIALSDRPQAIVFFTTAGKTIGFGHLRRCLTLAAAIRARAAEASIEFWVEGPAEIVSRVTAGGFEADTIEERELLAVLLAAKTPDFLIVDSYGVGAATLSTWRTHVVNLVVIDDLADRFIDAALVLNGSPDATSLSYHTSPNCVLLLGVRFALLRPTFRDLEARSAAHQLSRVLVTLGGADPNGHTVRAVTAVLRGVPDVQIDVVVGPLFGMALDLEALADLHPTRVRLHRNLDDISGLMMASEMAISGGGQTLYELAACGVPTIAIRLADNQRGNIAALAAASTLLAVDWPELESAAGTLASDHDRRQRMVEAGQHLVDGYGADRAAGQILMLAAGTGVASSNVKV